jgi:fucose permease
MAVVSQVGPGIVRDPATWYAYLAMGYQTLLTTSQGNILTFLKADLGLSYAEASLHQSAIAVGLLVVGLTGDGAIRRFGRTAMMRAGVLGAALGISLLCVAGAAWQSIGVCLIVGVFAAIIPAMASAILSDLHGTKRDIAYAEANVSCYAFAIIAPLVIALTVALGWNWRAGILLIGILGVFLALGFFATRLPEETSRRDCSAPRLPITYWAYFAMLTFSVALEFAAIVWAPSYFQQVVGLSPSAAPVAASTFFAAVLFARIAGVRLVQHYSPRLLFAVAIGTVLVGFVAYWGGAGWTPLAIAGLVLIGLGVGNLYPLILGFAMNAAGAASDRASTRAVIAPGIAIMASPPLLGTFADNAGLHAAQALMPVYAMATVAIFLFARAVERRAA